MGILFVVAMLLFLGSGMVYLGAYAYSLSISGNIAALKNSLDQKKKTFDVTTLTELSKTDARLAAAADILAKHRTLAPLFETLDYYTLQSVRFRSFKLDASTEGKPITIEMKGDAASYSSIALQSDAFSESGKLNNIIFSELNLDERGRVIFLFTANVDPSLLSYVSYVESLGGTAETSGIFEEPAASSTQAIPPQQ